MIHKKNWFIRELDYPGAVWLDSLKLTQTESEFVQILFAVAYVFHTVDLVNSQKSEFHEK